MNCKFCNAELEAENSVCPVCGQDNAQTDPEPQTLEQLHPETADQETVEIREEGEMPELVVEPADETADREEPEMTPEEPAQKPKKKWKIAVAVVACVVLVLAAAAAVWYAVNDGWVPRENNVLYKASYTADAEELLKNNDRVVASVGDCELTNAQLQIYYWMQFYDFMDNYGSAAAYYGLDYTQPMDTQMSPYEDGTTWQQSFLAACLDRWHRYQALCIEAEENGFELDPQLRESLEAMPERMEAMAAENGYDSAEYMLQLEMGPGATIASYMDYLYANYTANQYMQSEYEKLAPTDAQIEEYFSSHADAFAEQGITKDTKVVDVRHILVLPEGATLDNLYTETFSDEAWEAGAENAQAILDQWLAGDATEDSFAALANEKSADPGSNANGGLYTDVSQGDMVDAFDAWCFDSSRQVGDYGIVRTELGYHIMYFSGARTVWQEYAQTELLSELANQIVEDALAQHPMEVSYKKILIGAVDFSNQT